MAIIIGTSKGETLTGTAFADSIVGAGGSDILVGLVGDDLLAGWKGDDQLRGGLGNDTMIGGRGNDTYSVDSAGDQIFELANKGTDTVRTTLASYTLGSTLENLAFIGSGNFTGTGNSQWNVITGGGDKDTLDGKEGNDRLFGGNGRDMLTGADGNDTLDGGSGRDRLFGGNNDDTLFGRDFNDRLDGGFGRDVLDGGTGDDTLIGGFGNDMIEGGSGTDVAIFSGFKDDYSIKLVDGKVEVVDQNLGDGNDGTDLLSGVEILQFKDGKIQPPAVGVIDLATLNGNTGFTLIGIDEFDTSGRSVSSAGDVNGDGFDDVIVGAPRAETDDEGRSKGESYVVFGQASWAGTPSIDLATLDGANGFRLSGVEVEDFGGTSVSSARDVNGDGFSDLIVGAPSLAFGYDGENYDSEAYVVFGKASWAPSLDLATVDGTNGFRLNGADGGDVSGHSVSSAGDVNGDGFADLIVGAPEAESAGGNDEGESYVVFGKASWAGTPSLDLVSLDGTNGFRLSGIDENDYSGRSVSSAGDVNGDGFDDVIVGASSAGGPYGEGEAYVVFGKANWAGTPSLGLGMLDGVNGVRLIGVDDSDGTGFSVSTAGDVNGDGFADVIVGAIRAMSPGGADDEGASYVVFGKESWTPSLDLATLDGINGVRLNGIDTGDFSGLSVSSAGDLNGDGFADLIVGAFRAESAGGADQEGESYVVYGKASWAGTPALDLAALDGTNGFRLIGADANDFSGFSVSSAGDVNGDGFDDVIIGAPYAKGVGGVDGEGESYVVFGGNFSGAVTHLGGPGDDTLTGTAAAETFVGGAGNDTMIGKGGADSFQGGAGNDAITIGSILPLALNGGSGIDTVNLDATGTLVDLSGLNSSRFTAIEKLDLSGANVNTLNLGVLSVLDMIGTNGDAFADNTLLVKGDAGDQVRFAEFGWTQNGTVIDPHGETGTFASWKLGAATVLVEADVAVSANEIDLANLTGKQGFKILGVSAGDYCGESVSSAGDINGDGIDDVIVGANTADPSGLVFAGEAYVIYGKGGGLENIDLAALSPEQGFKISGAAEHDFAAEEVSSAGDVNGDGIDDVIVGVPGAGTTGASYVIYGKSGGLSDLELSALTPVEGFKISGAAEGSVSGGSVSSAGDVNGDGLDDLIIGDVYAAPFGRAYAGQSYVVYGKEGNLGDINLETLTKNDGFTISGAEAGERSGRLVRSAGDLNADGLDDVVIAVSITGTTDSAGYVVYSKSDGSRDIDLATLTEEQGFKIIGPYQDDNAGNSASAAGDINGDGLDDLIFGGQKSNVGPSGPCVVIYGKEGGPGNIDVETMTPDQGFRIFGFEFSETGQSVSGAGDVDGDGVDDFLVGAHIADPAGRDDAGQSYVVYGKEGGLGEIDLTTLSVDQGFKLSGIGPFNNSGRAVSAGGDIDGDGFDDVMVGAMRADPFGRENAGETYVIYGGDFRDDVTHLGTPGNDALEGTVAGEHFVSGLGNDVLDGGGGVDSFHGGGGDDTIDVATLDFSLADGGNGIDTLKLDGSGLHLDLTILADGRTRSIERVDVAGTGNNTLTLSIQDVLNLSDESNELLVLGDAGDVVNRGAGWTTASTGGTNGNGTSIIDGETYQIFTAGQASLLVDTDMSVAV